MKKVKFLLATILFSCWIVSAQEAPPELILEKPVAPHAKIDDIYRRFSEAYKKLDAEAVANLYTDDAFYLAPGSDVKRGREIILADFSGFFNSVRKAGGSVRISFQILGRQISGDLAFDVGIYTLTNKNAEGKARVSRGKFVVVARRAANGEWRFAVDGYSGLPNAESNAAQILINSKDSETLLDPIFDRRTETFSGERLKQIEPPHFVSAGVERAGQAFFGFKENANGEIAYLFQEDYMVFEKVRQ